MGLFDFLKFKREDSHTKLFSHLTLEEKASVYAIMIFIAYSQGRKAHPGEIKYMEFITNNILGLREKDRKVINLSKLNYFDRVNSFSLSDKEYFASVFYGLSTIVQDDLILKATSLIISDMGLSMEEVGRQYTESEKEMNNDPYFRFKTKNK